MQLITGFLSALLLASSAIPSAAAQRDRDRGRDSGRVTVVRTRLQYITFTERVTYSTTTTITKVMPWTGTATRRTTKILFRGGETVTVVKTVSSCDATKPTLVTKEPIPIVPSDKGEDPYSTCPPVATVTAMKKCDGNKPPCPREQKCVADQAVINYNCDCLKAPPRTITITTACPDECCGGYFAPRYNLLVPGGTCTGTMTAAPEVTSVELVRPPKLAPITASDEEPEEEGEKKEEEGEKKEEEPEKKEEEPEKKEEEPEKKEEEPEKKEEEPEKKEEEPEKKDEGDEKKDDGEKADEGEKKEDGEKTEEAPETGDEPAGDPLPPKEDE
ncbi:hypothetical protein TWF506_010365 [Arthrobotrys conoides]|uniref:Uncharacterized protein n=1 Tax=Arthrobotrys conoides TaxID=74498 RepID=A0AAN8N1I7_9PEZI